MPASQMQTQQATTVLRLSPLPALRRLSVEESEAEVIITGRVSSYYHKQLAQEAIRSVLEGRRLHNRVTVEIN